MSAFGVTAVVLFAIPLALGLIGYIVPLQIGARGVALPRLNLLSFWLYLAGARDHLRQLPLPAAEAGLAALPPLSDDVFSNTSTAPTPGSPARRSRSSASSASRSTSIVTLRNMRAPGHGLAPRAAVLLGGGA